LEEELFAGLSKQTGMVSSPYVVVVIVVVVVLVVVCVPVVVVTVVVGDAVVE
jgi:hypothetical protein